MKNDKLIPGLVLVLIGAAFLLCNFGYINFHWINIVHLWPIFLIVGGVNLVFANNRTPLATIIKVGVIILGFGLLLFGNFSSRWGFPFYSYSSHDRHDNNNDSDDNDDSDDDDNDTAGAKGIVKVEGSSNFILPYTADAKFAQLHISGGGTKYNLDDTTAQLFKADTREHFGKYEFTHFNTGSTYVLNFDMKDKKGSHFNWDTGNDKSNAVTFQLNPSPIWDISVETGATDLNFNLTPYKIRTLKLSGGAAKFEVKLGQPIAENTNVEVSTGMADVDINIPQSAACEIITDSALSSNSFDDTFKKSDDGIYKTPGFDAAKSKIIININGGISNFKVHKY